MFPIINIDISLGKTVGMLMGDTTIDVSVHDDNTGAFLLDRTFPPHLTLHIKYYLTKNIWFREKIVKHKIKIPGMDAVEQLGDLFTKFLPINNSEYLRKKIMGW